MAKTLDREAAAAPFWERASERQIFWSITALAAAVRFIASLPFAVGWYDEVWQYLEPAWHLIEGPWVQTWDFRYDIRSWLLPEIVAAPMALGLWLDPTGHMHLWLPRLMAAALSLLVVGCATQLGFRLSRLHGLMAGVITAIWFEMVFYAPRVQAETIGFSLFMGAVWLLLGRTRPLAFKDYFLAGIMLGLCVVLRAQNGPMVVLFSLYVVKLDFREKWLPLVLGGLLGICADIAANLAVGKTPLIWMWEVYWVNVVEGRASEYWTNPFYHYGELIIVYWGFFLAVGILYLTRLGIKHYPILFWVAVLNFLIHSALPHKEYRYVMASTGIFILLAALAMADLLQKIPDRQRASRVAAAIGLWAVGSLALGNFIFKPHWTFLTDLGQAHEVAYQLHDKPDGCGFAILAPKTSVSGSYALYRRDRPIYAFDDVKTLAEHKASFNMVLTKEPFLQALPPEFKLYRSGDAGMSDAPDHIFIREGACSGSAPEHHMNAWLKRHGN